MARKYKSCGECGSPLYQCGSCRKCGCQHEGCENRQFLEADKCRDCGRSWEMVRVPETSDSAPAPTGPKKRRPFLSFIPWKETALGVMVLGTLGAVVLYKTHKGDVGYETAQFASAAAASSKVSSGDVCDCYAEGFALHRQGFNVLSPEYKNGFVSCRRLSGVDGGDAWTAGWKDSKNRKAFERSCSRNR